MSKQESLFDLNSKYDPAGDQPKAINKVSQWIKEGVQDMTIHGITGSGKTFTMANIIKETNRPAIIYSPNKILAYQLYEELKAFFPNNLVHYYVSTFDLYRPEYIKFGEFHTKQSVTNDVLTQMALDATTALVSGRKDIIIVASSSCLYGTGAPEYFKKSTVDIDINRPIHKEELLERLAHSGYIENYRNHPLSRGLINVRASSLQVCSHEFEDKLRVWELRFDPEGFLSQINFRVRSTVGSTIIEKMDNLEHAEIFPATRYTQDFYTEEEIAKITENLMHEAHLQKNRLDGGAYELLIQRIEEDLNSIRVSGYCNGIENYAWYFNRKNMERRYDPKDYVTMQPSTLLSYLPSDTLMFIDESHLALGQIDGCAHADLSRKKDLIEAGIRLPSCVINRPLKKEEVRSFGFQTVYVSATPRPEELERSEDHVTELFIRPTYLCDPDVEVVYVEKLEEQGIHYNQHVIGEIKKTRDNGGAVLLRCPDKRKALIYQDKLVELGYKAEIMLADTPAPKRRELVERLQGQNPNLEPLDVIIGVNLIREGLDIPRVEKVLIVYADVGGFLNDTTSLIQVIGRAARNVNGKVFIYLQNENKMTPQIQEAIDQTLNRRKLQLEYNKTFNKTPRTAFANSYLSNTIAQSYNPEEDDFFIEREEIPESEGQERQADYYRYAVEQGRVSAGKDFLHDLLGDDFDFTFDNSPDRPSEQYAKEVKASHGYRKADTTKNNPELTEDKLTDSNLGELKAQDLYGNNKKTKPKKKTAKPRSKAGLEALDDDIFNV